MKTLVFSGSGVLFPAHLGAAQRLYESGYKPERFVGTSGGSIVAAYLATGAKPKDGLELARKTMPKDVLSLNWPFGLTRCWGLFNLDKLEKVLAKNLPPQFAFTKYELCVVTTNVDSQKQLVFSSKETPLASLPKAVTASCSIPIMFSPVRINNCLVDGGVVNNIAVDLFPDDSLGIRLMSEGEGAKPPTNLVEFVTSVIGTMMISLERMHIHDALFSKVVTIRLPWSGLDFWRFDEKVLMMLYNKGYEAIDEKIRAGWTWDTQVI